MLEDLTLPDGVVRVRATAEFTDETVPKGLMRGHRVASGVWGLLRVTSGDVVFVLESTGERRVLGEADVQVIEPDASHHVEPGVGSAFVVEFYE